MRTTNASLFGTSTLRPQSTSWVRNITKLSSHPISTDILFGSIVIGDLPSFPSLNRTVIPKNTDLPQLSKAQPHHQMLLGHLLLTASKIAEQEKLSRGFRIVINDGPSSGPPRSGPGL